MAPSSDRKEKSRSTSSTLTTEFSELSGLAEVGHDVSERDRNGRSLSFGKMHTSHLTPESSMENIELEQHKRHHKKIHHRGEKNHEKEEKHEKDQQADYTDFKPIVPSPPKSPVKSPPLSAELSGILATSTPANSDMSVGRKTSSVSFSDSVQTLNFKKGTPSKTVQKIMSMEELEELSDMSASESQSDTTTDQTHQRTDVAAQHNGQGAKPKAKAKKEKPTMSELKLYQKYKAREQIEKSSSGEVETHTPPSQLLLKYDNLREQEKADLLEYTTPSRLLQKVNDRQVTDDRAGAGAMDFDYTTPSRLLQKIDDREVKTEVEGVGSMDFEYATPSRLLQKFNNRQVTLERGGVGSMDFEYTTPSKLLHKVEDHKKLAERGGVGSMNFEYTTPSRLLTKIEDREYGEKHAGVGSVPDFTTPSKLVFQSGAESKESIVRSMPKLHEPVEPHSEPVMKRPHISDDRVTESTPGLIGERKQTPDGLTPVENLMMIKQGWEAKRRRGNAERDKTGGTIRTEVPDEDDYVTSSALFEKYMKIKDGGETNTSTETNYSVTPNLSFHSLSDQDSDEEPVYKMGSKTAIETDTKSGPVEAIDFASFMLSAIHVNYKGYWTNAELYELLYMWSEMQVPYQMHVTASLPAPTTAPFASLPDLSLSAPVSTSSAFKDSQTVLSPAKILMEKIKKRIAYEKEMHKKSEDEHIDVDDDGFSPSPQAMSASLRSTPVNGLDDDALSERVSN